MDNPEFVSQKMEKVLGVRVIGTIPEDPNVRLAASYKTPIVIKYPSSVASIAIKRIAAELAGVSYQETAATTREGFIDRFAKAVFRGKK